MTRVTEWVLGIVGGIAGFIGLFILFAGENQYIGLAGDYTWRVGDIEPVWGYGFLIGGIVMLAGAVALGLYERRHPHERVEQSERAALITHIAVFVLVNGFLWLQDIAAGDGLNYAYWITIPWGVGLIAHIAAYLSSARQPTLPRPAGG